MAGRDTKIQRASLCLLSKSFMQLRTSSHWNTHHPSFPFSERTLLVVSGQVKLGSVWTNLDIVLGRWRHSPGWLSLWPNEVVLAHNDYITRQWDSMPSPHLSCPSNPGVMVLCLCVCLSHCSHLNETCSYTDPRVLLPALGAFNSRRPIYECSMLKHRWVPKVVAPSQCMPSAVVIYTW